MRTPYQIGVMLLHSGCNMTCTFCITDDALGAMHYEHALEVLERMRARGMRGVVLGGGEPFTWRPGVLKLAEEAKGRGFEVQIGTNGVRLPEGYETLPYVDRYVLPLESTDPAVHNRMRVYGAGHHDVILGRLEQLRHARKAVTVSTVITTENVGQLDALSASLANYAASGGVLHAWHLYRFIPEGRGGRANAQRLQTPEKQYDAVCADLKERGLPFDVFKRKDMRHSKTVDFFWVERGAIRTGSEVWGPPTGRARQ